MPTDVRMQGFARRQTVSAVLEWLDRQARRLSSESVALQAAANRVLASSVVSEVDVPGFDRATMDGYAVVAEATDGASVYHQLALRVIGDALPGAPFAGTVRRGEAVRIMTGAPVPAGADAVLPAEFAETPPASGAATGEVLCTASISPEKNIGRRGEDVRAGVTLLEAGRVLRPQDVGVLSSIGVSHVPAVRHPRVRLVITGNELLPPGTRPSGCRITDANGPMLAALAARDGAVIDAARLVPDDRARLLDAMRAEADVVIVSGGSSVGIEDHAPSLLAQHGDLAVHGIAMRPSSPTGMGVLDGRLVFLLPGNPVSALCAYDFFAGRAIRILGGRPAEWPYRKARGTLTRKISSPVGRLDYVRVRMHGGDVEPLATGSASVLSSTTRADGFVVVADDSEGFSAGADVDVWLYA